MASAIRFCSRQSSTAESKFPVSKDLDKYPDPDSSTLMSKGSCISEASLAAMASKVSPSAPKLAKSSVMASIRSDTGKSGSRSWDLALAGGVPV